MRGMEDKKGCGLLIGTNNNDVHEEWESMHFVCRA